jgi:hypothetical protein
LALDWVLVKVMLKSLKERVKALESVIELDSAQKMERVLMLEQELVRAEVQDLILQSALDSVQVKESELKQKVLDLEMELESIRSKTLWKE